jgi:hypothetical protein
MLPLGIKSMSRATDIAFEKAVSLKTHLLQDEQIGIASVHQQA